MTNKIMTHMVCAYPNFEQSKKVFNILSKHSEYIEIQFPFSDPIADGPIIEKANHIALENGATTDKCFDFVSWLDFGNTKVLIMTYYNIVLNYWIENFCKKAKSIWIYGFIIPDVPFDEKDGEKLRQACKKNDLVFTEIVSPATTKERLAQISNLQPKLIYAISQNMTTGSKASFGEEFKIYIKNLKTIFSCPIGVWFWVKTKQDVEKVNKVADFAIIWSEFIKRFNNWGTEELERYLEWLGKR